MKIRNMLKIIPLFFISITLVACSTKSKEPTAVSMDMTVLEGAWTYQCSPVAGPETRYFTQTESYEGERLVQDYRLFKDSRCQTPLITEKFTGTFTIGKYLVDDHTNLDRIRHTVEVIILDKDTLTSANNSKLTDFGFGIKNWELNKPKDLSTNQNAIKYYLLNQDGPDIFKIELGDTSHDDQLYTGDRSNIAPNERPVNIDEFNWGTRPHK